MAIEISQALADFLQVLTGEPFPGTQKGVPNEDDLLRLSETYAQLARDLDAAENLLRSGAESVRRSASGPSVDAFLESINVYLSSYPGYLPSAAQAAREYSDNHRLLAMEVEYAKLMIIGGAIQLMFDMALAIAFAWFDPTAPLRAMAVARIVMQLLMHSLLLRIMASVVLLQMAGILMELLLDLIVQRIQIDKGTRKDFDKNLLLAAILLGSLGAFLGMGADALLAWLAKFFKKQDPPPGTPDPGGPAPAPKPSPTPDPSSSPPPGPPPSGPPPGSKPSPPLSPPPSPPAGPPPRPSTAPDVPPPGPLASGPAPRPVQPPGPDAADGVWLAALGTAGAAVVSTAIVEYLTEGIYGLLTGIGWTASLIAFGSGAASGLVEVSGQLAGEKLNEKYGPSWSKEAEDEPLPAYSPERLPPYTDEKSSYAEAKPSSYAEASADSGSPYSASVADPVPVGGAKPAGEPVTGDPARAADSPATGDPATAGDSPVTGAASRDAAGPPPAAGAPVASAAHDSETATPVTSSPAAVSPVGTGSTTPAGRSGPAAVPGATEPAGRSGPASVPGATEPESGGSGAKAAGTRPSGVTTVPGLPRGAGLPVSAGGPISGGPGPAGQARGGLAPGGPAAKDLGAWARHMGTDASSAGGRLGTGRTTAAAGVGGGPPAAKPVDGGLSAVEPVGVGTPAAESVSGGASAAEPVAGRRAHRPDELRLLVDELAADLPAEPDQGACITFVEKLAGRLYGAGRLAGLMRSGRIRDDREIGADRPGHWAGPSEGWQRVASWRDLARTVIDAGPGATAFVLMSWPGADAGHAVALHHTADGALWQADVSTGQGHQLLPWSADRQADPALARAVVVGPDGTVLTPPAPATPESASTARALIDAPTSRTFRGRRTPPPTEPGNVPVDASSTPQAEESVAVVEGMESLEEERSAAVSEDMESAEGAESAPSVDSVTEWMKDLTPERILELGRPITEAELRVIPDVVALQTAARGGRSIGDLNGLLTRALRAGHWLRVRRDQIVEDTYQRFIDWANANQVTDDELVKFYILMIESRLLHEVVQGRPRPDELTEPLGAPVNEDWEMAELFLTFRDIVMAESPERDVLAVESSEGPEPAPRHSVREQVSAHPLEPETEPEPEAPAPPETLPWYLELSRAFGDFMVQDLRTDDTAAAAEEVARGLHAGGPTLPGATRPLLTHAETRTLRDGIRTELIGLLTPPATPRNLEERNQQRAVRENLFLNGRRAVIGGRLVWMVPRLAQPRFGELEEQQRRTYGVSFASTESQRDRSISRETVSTEVGPQLLAALIQSLGNLASTVWLNSTFSFTFAKQADDSEASAGKSISGRRLFLTEYALITAGVEFDVYVDGHRWPAAKPDTHAIQAELQVPEARRTAGLPEQVDLLTVPDGRHPRNVREALTAIDTTEVVASVQRTLRERNLSAEETDDIAGQLEEALSERKMMTRYLWMHGNGSIEIPVLRNDKVSTKMTVQVTFEPLSYQADADVDLPVRDDIGTSGTAENNQGRSTDIGGELSWYLRGLTAEEGQKARGNLKLSVGGRYSRTSEKASSTSFGNHTIVNERGRRHFFQGRGRMSLAIQATPERGDAWASRLSHQVNFEISVPAENRKTFLQQLLIDGRPAEPADPPPPADAPARRTLPGEGLGQTVDVAGFEELQNQVLHLLNQHIEDTRQQPMSLFEELDVRSRIARRFGKPVLTSDFMMLHSGKRFTLSFRGVEHIVFVRITAAGTPAPVRPGKTIAVNKRSLSGESVEMNKGWSFGLSTELLGTVTGYLPRLFRFSGGGLVGAGRNWSRGRAMVWKIKQYRRIEITDEFETDMIAVQVSGHLTGNGRHALPPIPIEQTVVRPADDEWGRLSEPEDQEPGPDELRLVDHGVSGLMPIFRTMPDLLDRAAQMIAATHGLGAAWQADRSLWPEELLKMGSPTFLESNLAAFLRPRGHLVRLPSYNGHHSAIEIKLVIREPVKVGDRRGEIEQYSQAVREVAKKSASGGEFTAGFLGEGQVIAGPVTGDEQADRGTRAVGRYVRQRIWGYEDSTEDSDGGIDITRITYRGLLHAYGAGRIEFQMNVLRWADTSVPPLRQLREATVRTVTRNPAPPLPPKPGPVSVTYTADSEQGHPLVVFAPEALAHRLQLPGAAPPVKVEDWESIDPGRTHTFSHIEWLSAGAVSEWIEEQLGKHNMLHDDYGTSFLHEILGHFASDKLEAVPMELFGPGVVRQYEWTGPDFSGTLLVRAAAQVRNGTGEAEQEERPGTSLTLRAELIQSHSRSKKKTVTDQHQGEFRARHVGAGKASGGALLKGGRADERSDNSADSTTDTRINRVGTKNDNSYALTDPVQFALEMSFTASSPTTARARKAVTRSSGSPGARDVEPVWSAHESGKTGKVRMVVARHLMVGPDETGDWAPLLSHTTTPAGTQISPLNQLLLDDESFHPYDLPVVEWLVQLIEGRGVPGTASAPAPPQPLPATPGINPQLTGELELTLARARLQDLLHHRYEVPDLGVILGLDVVAVKQYRRAPKGTPFSAAEPATDRYKSRNYRQREDAPSASTGHTRKWNLAVRADPGGKVTQRRPEPSNYLYRTAAHLEGGISDEAGREQDTGLGFVDEQNAEQTADFFLYRYEVQVVVRREGRVTRYPVPAGTGILGQSDLDEAALSARHQPAPVPPPPVTPAPARVAPGPGEDIEMSVLPPVPTPPVPTPPVADAPPVADPVVDTTGDEALARSLQIEAEDEVNLALAIEASLTDPPSGAAPAVPAPIPVAGPSRLGFESAPAVASPDTSGDEALARRLQDGAPEAAPAAGATEAGFEHDMRAAIAASLLQRGPAASDGSRYRLMLTADDADPLGEVAGLRSWIEARDRESAGRRLRFVIVAGDIHRAAAARLAMARAVAEVTGRDLGDDPTDDDARELTPNTEVEIRDRDSAVDPGNVEITRYFDDEDDEAGVTTSGKGKQQTRPLPSWTRPRPFEETLSPVAEESDPPPPPVSEPVREPASAAPELAEPDSAVSRLRPLADRPVVLGPDARRNETLLRGAIVADPEAFVPLLGEDHRDRLARIRQWRDGGTGTDRIAADLDTVTAALRPAMSRWLNSLEVPTWLSLIGTFGPDARQILRAAAVNREGAPADRAVPYLIGLILRRVVAVDHGTGPVAVFEPGKHRLPDGHPCRWEPAGARPGRQRRW
jgi:hypothetical protein